MRLRLRGHHHLRRLLNHHRLWLLLLLHGGRLLLLHRGRVRKLLNYGGNWQHRSRRVLPGVSHPEAGRKNQGQWREELLQLSG